MLGKRGSVMLFLSRLPHGVTRKELKAFVQSALHGDTRLPFARTTAVCNCSILRITDPTNGSSELHGLVEVQPAKAAMQAIEELNGKELKGTPIEVRRYHHRSPLRDRRTPGAPVQEAEKRAGERRRKDLRIELISA